MPTPEQHALLSASSSGRWLRCTRAPRLEEQFQETTSEYAEAGRVAHAIAEMKARKYFLEPMSTRTYNARLKTLKEDPNYDKGMDNATDAYLDYLKELSMTFGTTPLFVALETRVDYSEYAPEGFGTADCILIGGGRICICDYKNGSGVLVAAENNSQMMLYALGALKVYAPIYGDTVQEIHLAVIQPNAGGVMEWGLTRAELEVWGESVVKPAAALAFSGEGAFCPGEGCRFCRARARCSARAAEMLALENVKGAPSGGRGVLTRDPGKLLTDAEIGDVLARGADLAAWYGGVKDYALGAALAGREIPGFKVVEGRGSREWKYNVDTAFDMLKMNGVEEALLWEQKPVTVAGLEKVLGKGPFAETAGDLVEKKPGKPALVPESDPRKPYNTAEAAFGAGSNG